MSYVKTGDGKTLNDFHRDDAWVPTQNVVKVTLANGSSMYLVYSLAGTAPASDQADWRVDFELSSDEFNEMLGNFDTFGARVVHCEVDHPLLLLGYGHGGYEDIRCSIHTSVRVRELATVSRRNAEVSECLIHTRFTRVS